MDYMGVSRTNYFAVKDSGKLAQIVANIDGASLSTIRDERRGTLYAIIDRGREMSYAEPEEDTEDAEDFDPIEALYTDLQQVVADGDACIIMEVGKEGMRYLHGGVTILTSAARVGFDLSGLALKKAREILHDPDWDTQLNY